MLDKMPELTPLNELAAELYYQARPSANQVTAEKKTFLYVRPEAVDALMRIHAVPEEDRPGIMQRIFVLQDLDNNLRPVNRKNARRLVSRPGGRHR